MTEFELLDQFKIQKTLYRNLTYNEAMTMTIRPIFLSKCNEFRKLYIEQKSYIRGLLTERKYEML